jgi:dTMP kinase
VYSFAPRPDLAFYFRVPIDVALDRLLGGRAKLKYHEAGMDVGLSRDPHESFRLFQGRVLELYEKKLVPQFGLKVIDAMGHIDSQQRIVRRMVAGSLRDYAGTVAEVAIKALHHA